MHLQALAFYAYHLQNTPPLDVLEFGSCDMNGSVRSVCPQAASWFGVDMQPGKGVDLVADAGTFDAGRTFDIVICAEAFEHTPDWRLLIDNAHRHLNPGGMFLASCATGRRPPHSAVDGGPLRPDEFYANVSHGDMACHLNGMGWDESKVWTADGHFGGDDLYVWAIR
jgi:SAM-dependent methyltransferase